MKTKVFITREEADKLNVLALELGLTINETEVKSVFEKAIDWVSYKLFGNKSCMPNELKPFR